MFFDSACRVVACDIHPVTCLVQGMQRFPLVNDGGGAAFLLYRSESFNRIFAVVYA